MKKKTVALALIGLLSTGTFGGILLNETVGVVDVLANYNSDAVVWKHYAAVAPTFASHGSKEFWANCSSLGEHQFEAPASGTIEEGGDFSLTAYFKELTPEDDRYVAKLTPKVTFDSNGGTAVESQDVEYNALASEPAAPTREADDYYDSYTFDGWYADGKKFDFTKPVTGNVDLVARWKRDGQKYEEVKLTYGQSSNVKSDDEKAITVQNLDGAFSQLAWSSGQVDSAKKAELIKAFGGESRSNDGVFVSPNRSSTDALETQNIVLPNIDFKAMLKGGKIMMMELGCYQNGSSIFINGEELLKNNSNGSIDYLNCAKAYFYLEGEAVKLRAVAKAKPGTSDVYSCKEISYDLSEDESNGAAGIKIGLGTNKYNRHYWIGHPRIVNGEHNLFDFSSKKDISVENGLLKTRSERDSESGAPYTQWKETTALSFDGVGALGNASKPLTVSYPKIDFNSLFAEGKGVRFALGSWNGQEKLAFEGQDFGNSGSKPNNPTNNTADSIANTWLNFQIEITRIGMSVVNHFENKEYIVSLSEKMLSGEEGLSFDLGTSSNNHFFYISNVKAFHA